MSISRSTTFVSSVDHRCDTVADGRTLPDTAPRKPFERLQSKLEACDLGQHSSLLKMEMKPYRFWKQTARSLRAWHGGCGLALAGGAGASYIASQNEYLGSIRLSPSRPSSHVLKLLESLCTSIGFVRTRLEKTKFNFPQIGVRVSKSC